MSIWLLSALADNFVSLFYFFNISISYNKSRAYSLLSHNNTVFTCVLTGSCIHEYRKLFLQLMAKPRDCSLSLLWYQIVWYAERLSFLPLLSVLSALTDRTAMAQSSHYSYLTPLQNHQGRHWKLWQATPIFFSYPVLTVLSEWRLEITF